VEKGNVDERSLLPKKHHLVEAGTQQKKKWLTGKINLF